MKNVIALVSLLALAGVASAAVGYSSSFESSVASWNSYNSVITQVGTGTNGVTSFDGVKHMEVTDPVSGSSGTYSTLGGYESTFDSGFTTSAAVYIDLADSRIAAGTYGFDLSQAINDNTGTHAQDNIFHVGAVDVGGTYQVLLNASQNSDFQTNSYKLLNDQGGNYGTFTESGWYTFEFDFAASATPDTVDITFTVFDDNGGEFWTGTGNHAGQYTLSNVGGNRYMWFTYVDADFLAVDAVSQIPEPATMSLLALGGLALLRRRSAQVLRRKK